VNCTPLDGFVLVIVIGCAAGARVPTVYVAKLILAGTAVRVVAGTTCTVAFTGTDVPAASTVIEQVRLPGDCGRGEDTDA
jgi:dolichol kinase